MTPDEVIHGLFLEFDQAGYEVGPERLQELIRIAYSPEGAASMNHVVRTLRVFKAFGFTEEMLFDATNRLRVRKVFGRREIRPGENPHRKECVASDWGYPLGWSPIPAFEKAKIIRAKTGLVDDDAMRLVKLYIPDIRGFENIVAVKPSVLARRWGIGDPFGSGYFELVKRLAGVVKQTYRGLGSGFSKTPLDVPKELHQLELLEEASAALRRLEEEQRGDLIVFPGQTGARWRGSSMNRVTWEIAHRRLPPEWDWKEFPLPVYAAMFDLIAQPGRLMHNGVLAIHCPGDHAEKAPFLGKRGMSLFFGHDNLHLIAGHRSKPDCMYGVATGLVQR